jgi:hypothetical protein
MYSGPQKRKKEREMGVKVDLSQIPFDPRTREGQVFSDEAYALADVAAKYFDHSEASHRAPAALERAASWAFLLVEACEKQLEKEQH